MWALGATFYTAVEGTPPFDGASLTALMAAILTRSPAPPQHAGPLRDLLGALLAKDPARRPGPEAVLGALADAARQPEAAARQAASAAKAQQYRDAGDRLASETATQTPRPPTARPSALTQATPARITTSGTCSGL